MAEKLRVAIVGAGISGLSCAYALKNEPTVEVHLFEKESYIGGHSNTISFTPKNQTQSFPIDTGFLVFNEWTYPGLIQFFQELNVPVAKSEMSFSVSLNTNNGSRLEWAGNNLDTLFAQRNNLLNPHFLKMLWDIGKFNRAGKRIAQNLALDTSNQSGKLESVSEFLERNHFSNTFRDWYLLPMIGSIWSCSPQDMLAFPIQTLMQFCHNHGLLNIVHRPQWMTVEGGSKEYVSRVMESLKASGVIVENRPVSTVNRSNQKMTNPIRIEFNDGTAQDFDKVIFACHSDQILELIEDPTDQEINILGAIQYKKNLAYVHEDASLLPQLSKVWAAWNYTCEIEYAKNGIDNSSAVCVHYLINKLQPLPKFAASIPVVVSLNPQILPKSDLTHRCIEYAHPIFDKEAIKAQQKIGKIQGLKNSFFCGAWTKYGFHEDGFQSGKAIAQSLLNSLSNL
jgi:uncharacterized protein